MRIWLVRHGESLGNVDEKAWAKIPDHQIPLTEFGMDQAQNAGKLIREYYQDEQLKDKKLRLWYSPYLRTVQTKDGIAKGLGDELVANHDRKGRAGWEDERLREQDFGAFSALSKDEQFEYFPKQAARFYNTRDNKGRHWAKAPDGESRAEVCERVEGSIETLMRDVANGHEDMVVVTHGVTMRAFEKRFLHHDIEWFETSDNPKNCDVVLIEGDKEHGYKVTPMFGGLKRPPSLPADYKNDPVGGYEALKTEYEYERPLKGLE